MTQPLTVDQVIAILDAAETVEDLLAAHEHTLADSRVSSAASAAVVFGRRFTLCADCGE